MSAESYFKALSDPTRRRITNLLLFHELNVNELVGILGMGQSRISRHLRVLSESGLAVSRKDGLWVFYRASKSGDAARFIDAVRYLMEEDPELAADLRLAGEFTSARRLATKRFFDSLASEWDEMKGGIFEGSPLVQEIVGRIPHCTGAADLGCGTGDLLLALGARAEKVIGVDSSPQMLAKAKERLPAGSQGNIELRIGELEHLPMREGEVQHAVINMVLHHLASPAEGVAEAHRVIGETGTLIVLDFCKHGQEELRRRFGDRWLGFDRSELERWFTEAAFRVVERVEFPLNRGLRAALYRAVKQRESALV
jgi:ArsR family transcriptional regulator